MNPLCYSFWAVLVLDYSTGEHFSAPKTFSFLISFNHHVDLLLRTLTKLLVAKLSHQHLTGWRPFINEYWHSRQVLAPLPFHIVYIRQVQSLFSSLFNSAFSGSKGA